MAALNLDLIVLKSVMLSLQIYFLYFYCYMDHYYQNHDWDTERKSIMSLNHTKQELNTPNTPLHFHHRSQVLVFKQPQQSQNHTFFADCSEGVSLVSLPVHHEMIALQNPQCLSLSAATFCLSSPCVGVITVSGQSDRPWNCGTAQ